VAPAAILHYAAHPGDSSIEHLEENVAAVSVRLTADDYKKLFTVPALAASR